MHLLISMDIGVWDGNAVLSCSGWLAGLGSLFENENGSFGMEVFLI
jgi:hypothetical protein